MDDVCVHCGQPIEHVGTTGMLRTTWVHRQTGFIHCNNLSGRIACPTQVGFE